MELLSRTNETPDGSCFMAEMENISATGANIRASQLFEVGAYLGVELPATGARSASQILALVVRVEPVGHGEWLLGCSFTAELSTEELEPFGAARVLAAEGDRRKWQRFPCEARAACRFLGCADGDRLAARVVEVSVAHICLLARCSLEAGDVLNLEVLANNGETVVNAFACVARVVPCSDGQWTIECNFLSELSERLVAKMCYRNESDSECPPAPPLE
jgi:hypothetical protein